MGNGGVLLFLSSWKAMKKRNCGIETVCAFGVGGVVIVAGVNLVISG
jgi:hypothetical protein